MHGDSGSGKGNMNHLETQIINSSLLTSVFVNTEGEAEWKVWMHSTGKRKPHDWQDTSAASDHREPTEPGYKRVELRPTVLVVNLQAQGRPEWGTVGTRMPLGRVKGMCVPAITLPHGLLRETDAAVFSVITAYYY